MSFYSLEGAATVGEGQRAPAGSLKDPDLIKMTAGYKRTVASRYRSVTPDELDVLPTGPLMVSPKVDGELWFLIVDGTDVVVTNPRGRILHGGLPFLKEAAKTIVPRAEGRTVVAGELFAARKGGRPRVGDLAAAIGAGEVERLGFMGFDLLLGGDAEGAVSQDYAERLQVLQRLFDGGKRLTAVKTEIVNDTETVERLFNEWAEGGKGEGIVIRPADGRIFKMKPTFTLDAAVIGFTERADMENMARSLLLAVMRENGQFQVIGSCGNLGPEEKRQEIHAALRDTVIDSNYRYASSTGALFQFVRPQMVVEVRLTDLQSDDSSGKPVRRMVLEYDEETGYTSARPMAGVSILHPVLERVRDDKEVNATDVRAAQLLERCHVEAIDAQASAITLPKSELLRREVYVQHKKDKHGVRKLLMWKTNKESVDPSYPPYVVQWTDYSSGRKDPLKREVRLAPDLSTAESIAEGMLKAGVKRGWEKVEAAE